MPYRRKGRTVQVKKGGRWRIKYRHSSVAAAERQLRALRINVGNRHGGIRRRARRRG